MKVRLTIAALSALCLCLLLAPAPAQEPALKTFTATGKTTLPPLPEAQAKALVAKLKAAAERVNGYDFDGKEVRVSVVAEQTGQSGADVFWRVRVTMAEGDANTVIRIINEDYWQACLDSAAQLQKAREDLKKAQTHLEELLTEQANNLGRHIDEESLKRAVVAAKSAMDEAELQSDAKAARIEAIEKVLAQTAASAETRAKDDPVLKELNTIAELEGKELDRLKAASASGTVPQSQLNAQMIKLAKAKAAAAERREAVTEKITGDVLSKLNAELINLRIGIAELEKSRAASHERWRELYSKLLNAGLEESGVRLETARKVLREAVEQVEYLERAEAGSRMPSAIPAAELKLEGDGGGVKRPRPRGGPGGPGLEPGPGPTSWRTGLIPAPS